MIKKIILIAVTSLALLFIFAYLVLPRDYEPSDWWTPADGGLRGFQFSKYTLPENYKMIAYADHTKERQVFIQYRDRDTNQHLALFVLRELPKVDFSKITFEDKKIRKIFAQYSVSDVSTDPNFKLIYLLPFFINEDFSEEYPSALVRGFRETFRETFETEKTKVLMVDGEFQELGFYRQTKDRFVKYPAPVFSYKYPMKGSLAFINNKANGETIFAFGCVKNFQDFDREEFKKIIESVTFDKEPRTRQDLFGTGPIITRKVK